MKNKKVLAFLLLWVFPAAHVQAYWVWSPEQGKFVNAEGATQDSAQDDYDYAMKFYRDKNFDEAEKRFEEIVKKYPQSRTAPEAQYRLGLVLEEKEEYLKAFKAYARLVESYPQSERFNEVIERELKIGNVFLSGKKAKFAGLKILPALPKAVEIYKHIIKNAPYSDFGDKAQFQLGTALKQMKRYGEAVEAFQAVIDQYPKSELISQARYEVAETAFLRSAANLRDQRALDDASKQVDRYMAKYPDAETAEKAAKMHQEIDEKNAEKNYRIGLYYEKDNYIESALIYYSDVAARYPSTDWGKKASEKLQSLKEPAKYVSDQQTALDAQEKTLQNKLSALDEKKDALEYSMTQRSLERLQKHRKTLDKDKKESLQRRKDDLVRREKELKQKFKNLEAKKKLLAKNQSEDLKKAIDRWNASLIDEQESLQKEKQQLEGWREELGVPDKKVDMSFLPFVGQEPTEIEKVQHIEAKKFFKLAEEKRSVLEEKETLYKHHGEVSAMLYDSAKFAPIPSAPAETENLRRIQSEIEALQKTLDDKSAEYEKQYGKSMLSSITGGVRKSWDKSIGVLNPFDGKKEPSSEQEILEHQMHLKERVAAQEALVQTLSQALDAQLAHKEQKRLMSELGMKENIDPNELRKTIRRLERKIRGGYEEIEERHQHKKELLKELDQELKQREKDENFMLWSTRKVAAPVTGTAKVMKAFFVGLPHEDEELTKTASKMADQPDTARIKQLEEEIKNESLLMEAKSQEINNQRKELEILKAQASLAGGYKFRSVFVDVPFVFFNEAMESARRIVPKKDREELLINRMNEETKKLENLRAELRQADARVAQIKPSDGIASSQATEGMIAASQAQKDPGVQDAAQKALKNEMETLRRQIETKKMAYWQEKQSSGSGASAKAAAQDSSVPVLTEKQSKKLSKEIREIEEGLQKLIRKETELESEETEILEKRISHIDKAMKKVHSKAMTQDLLTEKERMEQRLSELESRKDFLSQEFKRFDSITETGTPKA